MNIESSEKAKAFLVQVHADRGSKIARKCVRALLKICDTRRKFVHVLLLSRKLECRDLNAGTWRTLLALSSSETRIKYSGFCILSIFLFQNHSLMSMGLASTPVDGLGI